MLTGYDHLLFLVGVVFFMSRMRDVVLYVTLFTIGHSATLIAGVLGGWQVSPWLVDAVIALSVVYKAFDNLGGFSATLGFQPDLRLAVSGFGLVHGLGLATSLQTIMPEGPGRVTNLVSFNVGVEIGQILALVLVVSVLSLWRQRPAFTRYAFSTNVLLMVCGFLLMGYQITGYLLT